MGLDDAWQHYGWGGNESTDGEIGEKEQQFAEALDMLSEDSDAVAPDISDNPDYDPDDYDGSGVGDDLSDEEAAMGEWILDNAESPEDSGGPLSTFGDAVGSAGDAVGDAAGDAAGSVFPWWAKYAAAGGVLAVLLVVARPYVSVADGVVG